MSFYAHVMREDNGEMLTKSKMSGAPRVGEEIRMGGKDYERYYRVARVIWWLDEDHVNGQRVNIGVVPID